MSDPTEFLKVVDYSATSPRTMKNSAGQIGFAPHNLILASEDFSDSNWTKTDTTVTSNAAAAPDGTITADKISHDDTTADIYQDTTVISGQEYVSALCAKYIDHQWMRISVDGGYDCWFDIQNGVVGTETGVTGTITALADGWYYLTVTLVAPDTNRTFYVTLADSDGGFAETSGTEAYIWGAHLYENGLAGMFDVPEDQRALTSLTKYLPNKAVVTGPNLVSNGTFDNDNGWTLEGNWAVGSGTATSTSATNDRIYRSDLTLDTNATYKLTITVNSISAGSVRFRFGGTGSASNLAEIATVGTHVFHSSPLSGSTSIGVFAVSGTTADIDNITVTKVDRDPTAARFLPRRGNHEYIDGAWVKGLKAESEARTNLVTEAFDFHSGSGWAKANLSTAADQVTSPSGQVDADELIEASGTITASIYQAVAAGTHTVSCYMKANSAGRYGKLRMSGNVAEVAYDLSNGTIAGTPYTPDNYGIEDVGNGWYLCWLSDTSGVGYNAIAGLTDNTTGSNYTGDGTSSIYVWGMQVEAGSTPSSLIPTYGATRTRTAETFTQKSDKIIWPNTTYVDGTELVTNGTFDSDVSGWTGAGGTLAVNNQRLEVTSGGSGNGYGYQAISCDVGGVYRVSLDFTLGTGSNALLWVGTSAGGGQTKQEAFIADGSYTTTFVATSVTHYIRVGANEPTASLTYLFDNISVKEINPRALAVVMHGYMTYADTDVGTEATLWRQYIDANDRIACELRTESTKTGAFRTYQQVNGTIDLAEESAPGTYSPGINVPFKIASRHLDNAVQGATDGTATTENTTPPGLPDLSATQAEWFYDGGGFHIEDVLMYVEDIEEGGLTALTAKGFPQ